MEEKDFEFAEVEKEVIGTDESKSEELNGSQENSENEEKTKKRKAQPQPLKKLKLKKTWRSNFVTPTGIQVTELYCRRCVQYLPPKLFASSEDNVLDKNGMISVCKNCCE